MSGAITGVISKRGIYTCLYIRINNTPVLIHVFGVKGQDNIFAFLENRYISIFMFIFLFYKCLSTYKQTVRNITLVHVWVPIKHGCIWKDHQREKRKACKKKKRRRKTKGKKEKGLSKIPKDIL